MDKIAESIKALAAAVQTASDAYARYVDTYCHEAETYRKKYEQEDALRKMAMEAMKKRVRQLEHVCKINGIVVPGISDYTMSQPPFKEDA